MLSYCVSPLPWKASDLQLGGKLVVVGEHRAAVAIAAERLGRVEAGAGDRAERTAFASAQRAADRLRRILDHQQSFRFGDPSDRLIVGAEPEQIDGDDRFRLQPSFALDHVDRRFEAGDIDIVGVGIDVDEHRLGLGQRHHLGGRGEGEARHEDRIARPDAGRIERQQQRVGAVGAGNGVPDADIGGDLALELGDFRARVCICRLRRRDRSPP